MNTRMRLVALSVNTLVIGMLLAGCSDYGESDTDPATGGTGAGGSAGQTGGTGVAGGSGGSGGATGGTVGNTGGTVGNTGGSGGATGGAGGAADPCANVTPCGGDVSGTWSVTTACLAVAGDMDVAGFGLGCATAAVTGTLQVSGTWTANPDGTFTDNTVTSGTETLELGPPCLNVSGTTTTCPRLAGAVQALGFSAVTCAANTATGGCTCSATVQQSAGMGVVPQYPSASGSYTTAGNLLTISADQSYSYCASGATLTMTPQSTVRTTTVTGSIVLQRQ
jgi:hypothetical protein